MNAPVQEFESHMHEVQTNVAPQVHHDKLGALHGRVCQTYKHNSMVFGQACKVILNVAETVQLCFQHASYSA